MDIAMINTDDTGNQILFEIGNNPPILTGLNKLTQIALVTILTDPGSDKFDDFGGGLLQLLGLPVNPDDLTDMRSTVSVVMSDSQEQMLAEQDDDSLPTSERLSRIDLLDVRLTSDLELEVDISIINEDGEKAFIRL